MLSENQILKIKAEIEHAATIHLNTKDSETALNHFTEDVIAVSNVNLFASRDSLSVDVREYFENLAMINYASWDDVHIHVINDTSATFTAKFNYGFTGIDGQAVELKGIWTALLCLIKEAGKYACGMNLLYRFKGNPLA